MARLLDLESGGKNLPDAFRTIPIVKTYLNQNIVMVRHPQTGRLQFVQMYAALFGHGSSVYSFERWSAFLEAAPRRLLARHTGVAVLPRYATAPQTAHRDSLESPYTN